MGVGDALLEVGAFVVGEGVEAVGDGLGGDVELVGDDGEGLFKVRGEGERRVAGVERPVVLL